MHEQFLLAALEQAKQGRGQCAPNPSVGAVAVRNGQIIAQSWHRGSGTPHAESLLLAQIPPKTPGISLYVTLEPCNHWGRTPPCVDAIINHGVEQVFFSYLDPNPIVAQNNTSAKLCNHGVSVTHIPLPDITDFYDSYSYWTKTKKPKITVKMAQSIDGKIAGSNGERCYLSNTLCEQFTHQMRAASDVILTSARTIQQDNPRMNVRLGGKEQSKPVAIIDSQLSLNKDALIFSTASHCHIYHSEDVIPKSPYPNSSYHAIPIHNEKMDLEEVIKHLGMLGFHDVWVEAGGAIFTSLHQERKVHRTYLYLVPKTLGPNALSAYHHKQVFERPYTVSWQVMGENMITCLDWQEDECLRD